MGQLIHRYRGAIPYLLMLPGLLWLLLFFVIPNVQMFLFSLSDGTLLTGFTTPPEIWQFSNYPDSSRGTCRTSPTRSCTAGWRRSCAS